jgi:hypothetical protein
VLNNLNKLKVKNWTYLFKDRKACSEFLQKTKTHKVLLYKKKKKKKNTRRNRRTEFINVGVFYKLCHGSGGHLPPSYRGNPISIIGQGIWSLCLTYWNWD